MLESLEFFYDDLSSKEMGVINVNSSSGLFDEFFLPTREIIEQTSINKKKPYFLKMRDEPISFPMRILFDEDFYSENFDRVAVWLYQDYYKPLIFSEIPNRIFYAVFEGESRLLHNGLGQGYIDVNVRCDSSHAYSPEYFQSDVLKKTDTQEDVFVVDSNNLSEGTLDNAVIDNGSVKPVIRQTWGDLGVNQKWGDVL